MTIRTILVPVRGDGKGHFLLDHALAVAERFGAHIDVVYVHSDREQTMPYGIPVTSSMRKSILEAVSKHSSDERQRVRDALEAYCARKKLKISAVSPHTEDKVSISWREVTGRQSHMVASEGRFVDLIVIARPDPKNRLGINTLEEALFNTGKPVLLAQRQEVSKLGAHIAIAWNASPAASRAVTLGLPIIARADKVTIICARSSEREAYGADDLARFLRWHGVKAKVKTCEGRSKNVAKRVMSEASEAGADILLAGAHSRSRHKEIIMGSPTEHFIWQMTMPILMAR